MWGRDWSVLCNLIKGFTRSLDGMREGEKTRVLDASEETGSASLDLKEHLD